MSFEEATSKGLHPFHPVDPNMIHPRAPKRSIWHTRKKVAFDKAKKRIMEVMKGEQRDVAKNDEDGICEEELQLKRKQDVTCETSTSLTPIITSYPFDNETKTDNVAQINLRPLSSTSRSPISPSITSPSPISPSATPPSPITPSPSYISLSDNDPFDSDDDSLCSDDSIFKGTSLFSPSS